MALFNSSFPRTRESRFIALNDLDTRVRGYDDRTPLFILPLDSIFEGAHGAHGEKSSRSCARTARETKTSMISVPSVVDC